MADITTIKITKETKRKLDRYREHPSEPYDHVVRKMIHMAEDIEHDPELSRETLRQIDESRQRMARGEFVTLEEVAKKLGITLPPRSRPSSREAIIRSAKQLARESAQKAPRRR